jgi:hypothetical protein
MPSNQAVKTDTLHKWVGTVIAVFALTWGGLTYYVKAEDRALETQIQIQLDRLNSKQATNDKVNELVITIDKKLSSIESTMRWQQEFVSEVKELRKEVSSLKVELAKRNN